MSTRITITDGPLSPVAPATQHPDGVGSLLIFEGIVRREEGEGEVMALSYEVYEPMASKILTRVVDETFAKHKLTSFSVEHSRGIVPVGAASLRVIIESTHRGEALAAMAEFVDLLKRDVPIWKMPVWKAKA